MSAHEIVFEEAFIISHSLITGSVHTQRTVEDHRKNS